ncbi:MAG: ferrous iron transport protein B [Defluviitaleaceae bacterium]|nr:ferrous iron transport protein B [Defluviitaleaceae bacterium]
MSDATRMTKILLMGNPNVGKSIFFTELTGIHAISSNYAGTTVTYMEGRVTIANAEYTLIDVPGTYSIVPTSDAEAVAAKYLSQGAAAIICVLDSTNLERNLHLALELRQSKIPTIYILNLTDVAERHGITIDASLLSKELNAPVVSTIATKKQGLDELIKKLEEILPQSNTTTSAEELLEENDTKAEQSPTPHENEISTCGKCTACPYSGAGCKKSVTAIENKDELWARAKEITRRVSKKDPSEPSFMNRLGEDIMKPFPGVFISLFIMFSAISAVVFGGRGLRAVALLPLVNGLIVPFFRRLFSAILPEGILLNILVGEFGIFVISFEWILALIFPYVLLFYIVFGFLEDMGFLPRMSVLFDNVMRKLGVQGGSLIHMVMGYGCAVPAIIGSRAATSRKERIVISAAICFAIPCISQTGAIVSLLSAFAWWMFPAMMLFSLILFMVVTLIAGKFVKGSVDPLLIEVPNLLLPSPKSYFRKILTRMKHFLHEAEIPMMIAIVIAAVLAESGILNAIAGYAQPIVSGWLGLPEEAVIALILGIVRREMSVAPLLAIENLTALQAFVGGAVSLMYLPCISVFAILTKEFKIKIALAISFSTIVVAILVGGAINQIAQLFI